MTDEPNPPAPRYTTRQPDSRYFDPVAAGAFEAAGQLGAARAHIAFLLEEPNSPGIRQAALDWLIEAKQFTAGARVHVSPGIVGGGYATDPETGLVEGTVEAVRFTDDGTPVVDMLTSDGMRLAAPISDVDRPRKRTRHE